MESFAPSKSLTNSRCADFMMVAERQLASFFNAVTELFGSEQAELSAEDWLRELRKSEHLPTSRREWELISARASTRLAARVNAAFLSPEIIGA